MGIGKKILAGASTHDLYCYVVGWALLQKIIPDCFEGSGLAFTSSFAKPPRAA